MGKKKIEKYSSIKKKTTRNSGTRCKGKSGEIKKASDIPCAFYIKTKSYVLFLFLIGFTISFLLSLFTNRPEMFFTCTLIMIMSILSIIYDIRNLNGVVVSLLPIYIVVVFMIDLPNLIMIPIHFLNLIFISLTFYIRYKNISSLSILIGMVFWLVYIYSTYLFVNPLYSDYYHVLFAKTPSISILHIITDTLIAIIYYINNGRKLT